MGKRLEDKVAVITGGTSGIGERTAEIFVEQGASVVIAGRSSEKGDALSHRLGEHAIFARTDVTRESDVENMINLSVKRFGRIDCLFNNAGAPGPIGAIEEIALADVNAAISLLFGAVFLGMKYVAPIMKEQGGGCIINNASIAGIRVGFGPTIYSAAKAAVIQLTKCTAMELAPFGVRVNSISPGGIATPIIGKALGLETKDADRSVDALISYLKERLPLQRSGLPDDIAYGALYLASEEGSFVTGHDLVIDSGIIAGRTVQEQAMMNEKLAEVVLGAPGG
jgi:NAD(P)-dependent dehydrogenase (short-subunit alcohol dehydrogenase family)